MMHELPLFAGQTYEARHDAVRLSGQVHRVHSVMSDGRARTLHEIQSEIEKRFGVHDSQTGIAARTRDLRKAAFGGYTVESSRRGDPRMGLWEYRLIV